MWSEEYKKEYRRKYRLNNLAKFSEYQKLYSKLHPETVRICRQKWNKNNPDKLEAYRLKKRNSYVPHPKIRKNSLSKEDLIKVKARQEIRLAVKSGKIIKKNLCEKCSSRRFVEAHHDDYSKPLDVRWLCSKHHKEWHRKAIPLMP